jgi:hypothetical protein
MVFAGSNCQPVGQGENAMMDFSGLSIFLKMDNSPVAV